MPDPVDFRWKQDSVVPDSVSVDFASGAESGVETRSCFFGANNTRRRHEARINGPHPAFGSQAPSWDVDMRDLPQRVDSGIRAAGTLHHNAAPQDVDEGTFQGVLNGTPVGLALPALEAGSVIGDLQANSDIARSDNVLGIGALMGIGVLKRSVQDARKLWESSQPWRMSWAAT